MSTAVNSVNSCGLFTDDIFKDCLENFQKIPRKRKHCWHLYHDTNILPNLLLAVSGWILITNHTPHKSIAPLKNKMDPTKKRLVPFQSKNYIPFCNVA